MARVFALVAALFIAVAASAAPLTPAQTLDRRTIGELEFAPDGSRLVFSVTEPPSGTTRPRHLWLLDVATRESRQLTFSDKTERSPRWSPDGSAIAFISDREGAPHLYVLSMRGGEGRRIVAADEPVSDFRWSPDGARIAFLMPPAKTDELKQREKDKDDGRRVDKDERRARVWIVDVMSHDVRPVTTTDHRIEQIEWIDGQTLAAIATDRPADDRWTERIVRIDIATGQFTTIANPRGPFGDLAVSPDAATLAWVGARVDGPEPHDIWIQPIAGGPAKNITGGSLDRPIRQLRWIDNRAVSAVAERGFGSEIITIDTSRGDARTVDGIRLNPSAFARSRSGLLAYVSENATTAPEICLKTAEGVEARVTTINEKWKDVPVVAPRFVHYGSFDGLDIEAALLTPASTPGPLPLIVLVHGGPTGRWADVFEPWGQLLVARGYAVLYPNIRGSTGYGQKFVEMNRGDWGGADFKDVMAGVDAMVATGVADPNRLGIGGWSYGGYMSAWAITQTDRFKVAVSGAPMSDLASEFGTEQGPAYDEWFYGVPYEQPDGFVRSSPIAFIKRAKTPTLILQGEADVTDPIGQSQQLYRGLKRYGVETDLVVYPREGHGLREEKHLLDRLNRILAWYDRFLKSPATN